MQVLDTWVARAIPWIPRALVRRMSRRYIAGDTMVEALQRVRALNAQGFTATIDVLGETAASLPAAQAMADELLGVLESVRRLDAQATVSVKPTALGLLLDPGRCRQWLTQIVEAAGRGNNRVCIDMESVACTQLEIELFTALRVHHANVDLAVQAYLRRTYRDLDTLLPHAGGLRVCKGIYREDAAHLVEGAAEDRRAINVHFLRHVERCFAAGCFVSVATHDGELVGQVIDAARRRGIDPAQFEFQMLLGVCEPLRDSLRAQGFDVRIYVPFGADWYGYSTRRLKENPRIAGHVARALFDLR